MDARLPLGRLIHHTMTARVPVNLNWMWVWGMVLVVCLGLQIATGVALAMHYVASPDLAFASVERIMRDVPSGHLIRAVHANGASLFFLAIYLHIFRGIYYGSHKPPREMTWLIGMVLYVLMMATAFMGYVLPWSQMGVGGATVVAGMFGAIPVVGEGLKTWILGGPAVGGPTLTRFFVLHWLLPGIAVLLTVLHVWGVHVAGNNNPSGVEARRDHPGDTRPFWPFMVVKELFALAVIFTLFAAVTAFLPGLFLHPETVTEAGLPAGHVVPEWYFLPFFAMLRAITPDLWLVMAVDWATFGVVDAAFLGVLVMAGSLLVLPFLPWLDRAPVRSARYRPVFRVAALLLAADFAMLAVCGALPPEGAALVLTWIGTAYWFGFFLILLPLLSRWERTRALPPSVEAA
nr:cytochrome b N-terminal domain-containing protein [Falsirhodobacter halotolerans]